MWKRCFNIVKPVMVPSFNKFSKVYSTRVDSSKLFLAISTLSEEFGIKIKHFPAAVTMGPQSAGKSSVIEALVGENILPKQMGIATKKPMTLTLIHHKERRFKVADK